MRLFWSVLGLLVPLLCCAQQAADAPAFAAAASDAKRLQLMPGLKLTVWAAEPQLSNSVAFSFDGKGRVFLAESDRWDISVFDITKHTNWLLQDMSFRTVADRAAFLSHQFATNLSFLTKDSEAVRLIEDRDGDGQADRSEIIASGFNSVVDGTAAGVLATGTNLYFANIPNLWRLSRQPSAVSRQQGEADGRRLTAESLASGFGVHIGVSGHDLHGLIKGPDGRIYLSFGDRGVCLTNREGVVINLPDTGGVLRCEPDGRDLELFCFGLRNPQELAFDDLGNLWTVDNDTAGADQCRVLHLVEGADYGWRTSYQHMPGFGPWVQEELWKGGQDGILPPAGTVSQGPSGLAFYPGTGFGDRLAGTFLHCDFPGGVWAYTVKPQGASYVVDRKEKFLWNCWPTDVDFGPDGAAYVLDWVAGWGQPGKGRIYRIVPTDVAAEVTRRTGSDVTGESASSRRLLREAELVAQVKHLLAEGMTQRGEKELLDLLGHADRRVRLEAQWELVGRGANGFVGLAGRLTEKNPEMARLHAIWALGQIARQTSVNDLVEELHTLLPLAQDNDPEVARASIQMFTDAKLINLETELASARADSPRLSCAFASGWAKLYPFQPARLKEGLASKAIDALPLDFIQATKLRVKVGKLTGEDTLTQKHSVIDRLAAGDPFERFAAISLLASGPLKLRTPGTLFGGRHLDYAATNQNPAVRILAVEALRLLATRRHILPNAYPFPQRPDPRLVMTPAITNFLSDPDPRLVIAAGRAIHDVPIVEGFPALAQFITRIDCPTNLMSRVIDTCYRLGTQQHAQMLAGFAAREDVADWARVLALRALADWEKPSPLDRVNGLWRPLVHAERGARDPGSSGSAPAATTNPLLERAAQAQAARNLGRAAELPVLPADLGRSAPYEEAMALRRNPAPAQRAFLRVAGDLMNPFNLNEAGQPAGTREVLPLQIAVAEAAAKLRVKEAGTPLFEKFARADTAPGLRCAILPALAELRSPFTGEAVKLALADADPALRAAALPHLDRLEGEDAVGLLAGLVAAEVTRRKQPSADLPPHVGGYALAQAALAALAKLPGEPARTALREILSRLEANQLPPELALDVREAVRTQGLQGAVGSKPAALSGAVLRDTLLVGGDAERGRQIFFGNQTVQCSRCHAVGANGGTVGPKLDGLGQRQPRAYLLESLVQPSVKLADGFETVVLTLRDGHTVAGTLKRESSSTLEVETTDEAGIAALTRVVKSDVTQRERGPSAMPEGLVELLTPFELRDLVEYLASLK